MKDESKEPIAVFINQNIREDMDPTESIKWVMTDGTLWTKSEEEKK